MRLKSVVSSVVMAMTAGTALAACSGDGDGRTTVAGGSTSTTAPAPATSAPGAPDGTGPSSGSGEPAGAFAGDTNPDISSEVEGYPVLTSVTQGEHDGYRRYVFTFRHADPEGHQPWRTSARPKWDVRYVPGAEAVKDGSGDPVANAGANAHLRILFDADMHYADGRSSLERSVNDEPPDLVFAGDFENRVTWFYGTDRERPFRVVYLAEGRVVVDIAG
jgi:hypothetical protein